MHKYGRELDVGGGGGGVQAAPRCCCLLSKVCNALQSSPIPFSHMCAREYTMVAFSGKPIVCFAPSI